MADTSWKRAERMAAKLLGGDRNPLSGSTSLHTSGDVIHPAIYAEVKYRKRHTACSLMRSTAKLAKKESKLPVLVLQERGRHGGLLCLRTADLPRLIEILSTLPEPDPNVGGRRIHVLKSRLQ